MKHFKVNQTVYYFRKTGQYIGEIIVGKVTAATKNLATGVITYKIENKEYYWLASQELTADYLYSSYKKAFNEHKDEIAYNALMERIDSLEKAIDKVFSEYAEKIEANPTSWITLSEPITERSILIDGIGNLQEEFNKLKKEVTDIKKKIKKPTKKSVKKASVEPANTELAAEESKEENK